MKLRFCTILLFLLTSATFAKAQFYIQGSEPGGTSWKQITTDNYRLIYPSGTDSLARIYASKLEQYRGAISKTCGFLANQAYTKPMPVVIHPYGAISNGSVAWTPRRMDIFTTPESQAPDPTSWETLLAVHEGRHVAQMQYVNTGKYRIFSKLTGELAAGALSGLYCSPSFFEGDAVCTETDLLYGRGRTGDFLDYFRYSFNAEDFRDVYKWTYGSIKKYTPDYYHVGYLFFAGMKELYGVDNFAKRYFDRLLLTERSLFPIGVLSKTTKEISDKNYRDTFNDIAAFYKDKWDKENLARQPYMPAEQIGDSPKFFTSYDNLFLVSDKIYSTVSGLVQTTSFNGKPFKSGTSKIKYSEESGKMYWSEIIPDKRWEQLQYSIIKASEPESGVYESITSDGRLFNPTPSPDGSLLSVTEYPYEGGSRIKVLDAESGETYLCFQAPDGLQAVESSWIDNDIYVTGVSDSGTGIYIATDNFRIVLSPSQTKIKQLWSEDDCLYFTADRTGVNELYELDPKSGKVLQLTSTAFGAENFTPSGDYLIYTALSGEGNLIFRTKNSELPIKEVDFYDYYAPSKVCTPSEDVRISEVEDYDKVKNLIGLHSWLPLFVNYDEIAEISEENIWSTAGIGATGFFQNELGTLDGSAGIGVFPELAGFARVTYRGLYPVFSGEINVGKGINSGRLETYVPLNFSSEGWRRGLIPRAVFEWNEINKNSLGIAVRAYNILPVANSCIYPRLGIGGELGAIAGTNRIYGSVYGYLPGFLPHHGIRLSALLQKWNPVEEHAFGAIDIKYALPFLSVDWSKLSPVAYIKNFEAIFSLRANTNAKACAGVTLLARLGNITWLPYDTRIGVDMYVDHGFHAALSFNVDI